MKSIFSRLTLRGTFILLSVTEFILGASYIGVILSQNAGLVLSTILQYTYRLLHTVAMTLCVVIALRQSDGRRLYRGLPAMALLLLALVVKDYLINFYSITIESGYLAGDALLLALPTTLINTLLITGVYLFSVYSLAYLFFIYSRPRDTAPTDMWALPSSHMLAAACFIVCAIGVPDLIVTLIGQIVFLARDAMWLPTVSEVVSMALDLLLIPLFTLLSYLVAYAALRYTKETPDAPVKTAVK